MSRTFHNVTPGIMIFEVAHLETSNKFLEQFPQMKMFMLKAGLSRIVGFFRYELI